MEDPAENSAANGAGEQNQQNTSAGHHQSADITSKIFACCSCSLKERYDYKGAKPPFARQLIYSEECYAMKDPFSLPNRGEILILGGDCGVCKRAVCLGCSIFYGKRFCARCATMNLQCLPAQLHGKIGNLMKHADT